MKRLTFRSFVFPVFFLFQTNAFSQQREISGKVVDAEGQAADGTLLWYK